MDLSTIEASVDQYLAAGGYDSSEIVKWVDAESVLRIKFNSRQGVNMLDIIVYESGESRIVGSGCPRNLTELVALKRACTMLEQNPFLKIKD